jgi:tripartite-type tricarboxylate transporter receptor subunit TctC
VPTHQESGFEGFTASSWVGLFLPAKTSDDIARHLNTAVNHVLRDTELQQKLREMGFEPNPASLNDADAEFKREIETWGRMVNAIATVGK